MEDELKNTISNCNLMVDECGITYGVGIEIFIPLKELKDNGVDSLYNPIFDEVKRIEEQLRDLGYIE